MEVKALKQKELIKIKLYWSLGCPSSMAVKSILICGDIAHSDQHIDIFKNEHKQDFILSLSPFGSLPIIIANEKVLLESSACLRFIATVFPSLNRFYPNDIFLK